jgi:hypothetical protein
MYMVYHACTRYTMYLEREKELEHSIDWNSRMTPILNVLDTVTATSVNNRIMLLIQTVVDFIIFIMTILQTKGLTSVARRIKYLTSYSILQLKLDPPEKPSTSSYDDCNVYSKDI